MPGFFVHRERVLRTSTFCPYDRDRNPPQISELKLLICNMPDNERDKPMRTEEDDDIDSGSGSGSSSGSESEAEVELLVNTREKRATAGNRLTRLLQREEPDDELELLFAEEGEDEEFNDEDADSDVQMDSSDDDDDQGPTAGAEDLEGEKELQKKERAEKLAKKKKKLGDGIPFIKKKVKIDPTVGVAAPPRPKKKSERASWIPTADEAPTRASKRNSTKQSKEQLMAQMVDREIKRVKQLESMERSQARKEAAKKPAMTQADRLAEAARVEKRNFKSLSRWEEAEQQREEEQAAKLAALSNRHMDGPVITWWSGIGTYVGGTLKKVGKTLELEDPKEKQSRKRKAAEMEAELAKDAEFEATEAAAKSTPSNTNGDQFMTGAAGAAAPNGHFLPANGEPATNAVQTPAPSTSDVPAPNGVFPAAEHENQDSQSPSSLIAPPPQPSAIDSTQDSRLPSERSQISTPSAKPPVNQPPTYQTPAPPSYPPLPSNVPPTYSPYHNPPSTTPPSNHRPPSHPPFILAPPQQWNPPPSLDGSSPLVGFGPPPLPRLMPSQTTPFAFTSQNQPNQAPPPPPPPPGPPPIEHAALTYIIMSNFEEEAIKDKHVQTQILMGRRFIKNTSAYSSIPFSPRLPSFPY